MPVESIIAILAGGTGKRLWPLSTAERPKQFVPLFSGRSMLQQTFDRSASVVGADAVFVVGNVRHANLYLEQLPDLREANLILEPAGRGTAAALALTATVCDAAAPGAVVATVPCDHVIPNPTSWIGALQSGLAFARRNDCLVCLGAPPRKGETKFGYMMAGRALGGPDTFPVKVVDRFVEKPDEGTLEALITGGRCLRNMGVLIFRPGVLASEMERFAADTYGPVSAAAGIPETLERAYAVLTARSIDEAVLQHSDRAVVVDAAIESADAGDFVTLGDAIGRDERGNASTGPVVAVDATDNTVIAGEVTVALVGVKGLVVVVEGDRILVCPADETQRIKQIPQNS